MAELLKRKQFQKNKIELGGGRHMSVSFSELENGNINIQMYLFSERINVIVKDYDSYLLFCDQLITFCSDFELKIKKS